MSTETVASAAYANMNIPSALLKQLDEQVVIEGSNWKQHVENSQQPPSKAVAPQPSVSNVEEGPSRIALLEQQLNQKDQAWKTLQGMISAKDKELNELRNKMNAAVSDASKDDSEDPYDIPDEIREDESLVRAIETITAKQIDQRIRPNEAPVPDDSTTQMFFLNLNYLYPGWNQLESHPDWPRFATPQVDAYLKQCLANNDPEGASKVYIDFYSRIQGGPSAQQNLMRHIQPNPSATPPPAVVEGPRYSRETHMDLLAKHSRGALTPSEKQMLDEQTVLYRKSL